MNNHDDSTFLAIMAICIFVACVAGLVYLPPCPEIPPLTKHEKQSVVNRW